MKKVTRDGVNWILDSYVYTASLATLAAGNSDTDVISIEADTNFVVVKAGYFASLAGAAQTESTRVIPLINVSITDSGSGRQLQNQAQPISVIAGAQGLPLVWPVTRTFKASSSIQVTFDNFSSATDYDDVSLSLIGYKMFRE